MARVLVIGTDQGARLVYKNILECAGYAVSTADSFAEGRTTLRQSESAAVLTDLPLSESEALQSVAQLRAEFPRVKILAIAHEHTTLDYLAVRMMGVDDVLRQPMATDALLDAVEQALGELDTS